MYKRYVLVLPQACRCGDLRLLHAHQPDARTDLDIVPVIFRLLLHTLLATSLGTAFEGLEGASLSFWIGLRRGEHNSNNYIAELRVDAGFRLPILQLHLFARGKEKRGFGIMAGGMLDRNFCYLWSESLMLS